MNEKHIEDIITALYDLIQDARSLPLGADKCIVERDKVLDMLDEISAQLPAELKQSRTIVESRNELIGQAKREAESIVRRAQEEAERLKKLSAVALSRSPRPRLRSLTCVRSAMSTWTTPCVAPRRLSHSRWPMFRTPALSSMHWLLSKPVTSNIRFPILKQLKSGNFWAVFMRIYGGYKHELYGTL